MSLTSQNPFSSLKEGSKRPGVVTFPESFQSAVLGSRTRIMFEGLLRLITGQHGDKVALLLISLSSRGQLLNLNQSNATKKILIAGVAKSLREDFSSISMLDESTIAVILATGDLSAQHSLLSKANTVVRTCCRSVMTMQGLIDIEAKGGLSTPIWRGGDISSLVPFSRLALNRAELFKVYYYASEKVWSRNF